MATNTSSKPQPVSHSQLQNLALEACDATFGTTSNYIHTQTESWNNSIISKILNSLLTAASASSTSSEAPLPQYKYAVNSTIIQHLTPTSDASLPASTQAQSSTNTTSTQTTQAGTSGEAAQTISPPGTPAPQGNSNGAEDQPQKGRRGMHSATGAYWNDETDGMWNYKWEGGEARGMDVVVSVIWVAI